MNNKNKVALKDRLLQALYNKGWKAADLVEYTNIPKSAISYYLSGKSTPKTDRLYIIAEALGVSETWLMGYDVPMTRIIPGTSYPGTLPAPKTVKKPLIGSIACGTPILAVENFEGNVEVPENIKCDFALKAKGDSMIGARINDGDIVYIREQPDVENGQIAAVLLNEEEATLKRVRKVGNVVMLVPENPNYDAIILDGNTPARIIGLAVGFTSVIAR